MPLFFFVILYSLLELPAAAEEATELRLRQAVAELERVYGGVLKLHIAAVDVDSGTPLLLKGDGPFPGQHVGAALAVVATALKSIGPNHTFVTEIFGSRVPETVTQLVKGTPKPAATEESLQERERFNLGNLSLRGYGDPTLNADRLEKLAQLLADAKIGIVEQIVVDDSLFKEQALPSSALPSGVGHSATSINGNAYSVVLTPTTKDQKVAAVLLPRAVFDLNSQVQTVEGARVAVSILQRPLSEDFMRRATSAVPLAFQNDLMPRVRVNVEGVVGDAVKSVTLVRSVPSPPAFLAAIFKQQLETKGILVRNDFRSADVASTEQPLTVLSSDPLERILTNAEEGQLSFIASQLLYVLGQDKLGYFSREAGRERVMAQLRRWEVSQVAEVKIIDGAGAQPGTVFGERIVTEILRRAYRDLAVWPHLVKIFKQAKDNQAGWQCLFASPRGFHAFAYTDDSAGRRFAVSLLLERVQPLEFDEGLKIELNIMPENLSTANKESNKNDSDNGAKKDDPEDLEVDSVEGEKQQLTNDTLQKLASFLLRALSSSDKLPNLTTAQQ